MTTPFHLPPGAQYEWPMVSDLERRFWAKVDVGDPDECWPWTAFCNPSGYGMVRNGTRMAVASRVSWVIHNGPIPDGLQVRHSCDNPPCVNPSHLLIGTSADNARDRVERDRSPKAQPKKQGELHHGAKLTWAQVQEIRSAEGLTGRQMAAIYGVSPATICNVLKRKVWRTSDDGPRARSASGAPAHDPSARRIA